MQQNETKVSPNMHIRASVDYISENVTDIVFNRTLHIKLWNWTCGPGGDQRVAIFEAPPEAPPPPGASPPGERLEKKNRPTLIHFGGEAVAARTVAKDGLTKDSNHRGSIFRSGVILRVHGDHQAHSEAQQRRVQWNGE